MNAPERCAECGTLFIFCTLDGAEDFFGSLKICTGCGFVEPEVLGESGFFVIHPEQENGEEHE